VHLVLATVAGGIIGSVASMLLKIESRIASWVTVIAGAVVSLLAVQAVHAMNASLFGPAVGWVVSVLGAGVLIALLQVLGALNGMAAAQVSEMRCTSVASMDERSRVAGRDVGGLGRLHSLGATVE
jgi:uncharacterized membrane protein YeaQ/YmgE (transglycosylase-associated protein family)